MNPGSNTFEVRLQRDSEAANWGFRLQGGADFDQPLCLGMVNPGGLAEQFGLKSQDGVLTINGINADTLSHEEAKYEVLRAAYDLSLLVTRGAVSVWQPSVTPLEQVIPPGGPVTSHIPSYDGEPPPIQRTSLAANKQEFVNTGAQFNRTARGFTGSSAGPPQPSAPPSGPPQPGLYPGPQTITPAHTQLAYSQPPPAMDGVPSTTVADPDTCPAWQYDPHTAQLVPPSDSGPVPGFRPVGAPRDKPPGERKQGPTLTCATCNTLVVGPFVRIKNNPMHPECFKCARCSKNLKNQGYFDVNDALHCEACAVAVAEPPEPGMEAVPTYR